MKHLSTVAIAVVLLALLVSGCGAKTAPAPSAVSTAIQSAAAGVKDKAAVALTEPTAEADAEEATETPTPRAAARGAATVKPAAKAPTAEPTADDSLSLDSRDTGLDKLKSYRMQWKAQWQGVDDGKADSANWDWVEEYSSEPQALHFMWKTTDSTKDKTTTAFEVWQVGNVTYMATPGDSGDSGCMSFSSDDQNQAFNKGTFSPTMLGSLHDARFVGNDTVNGVPAKHYRYDQKSASLAGFGNVSGDAWVAVDGGYVVKDVMKWEGAAGLFGGSSTTKGNGQWTWELSNVNQPIAIKAPDNCGGETGDLPLLNIATDKTTLGDMISYKSPTSLADAVAFYQKAMPDDGWQADGEPQTSDQYASLNFSKEQKKAQIMISGEGNTVQVVITVTKEK